MKNFLIISTFIGFVVCVLIGIFEAGLTKDYSKATYYLCIALINLLASKHLRETD